MARPMVQQHHGGAVPPGAGGYAVSQRIRKRVEEIFGWMKTVGGFRRTRYRGLDRTGLAGYLVATAYNLVRMSKLLGQAAAASEARMA